MSWEAILGGAIGSATEMLGDYLAIDQQKWANIEQQREAYGLNLQQWERENKYNTPSAQMERLKAAGLNPNLVYGSGTATQSSARSPQREAVQVGKANYGGTLNQLGQYMGVQMTKAQVDNIKAQTEATKIDNRYKEETLISRTNTAHLDWNKKHWEINKIINEGMVQEQHREEIQRMAIETLRNNFTKSQFEAWLSDQKFNKNDSLVARKAFEWAEKTGFDKKLGEWWKNSTINKYLNK